MWSAAMAANSWMSVVKQLPASWGQFGRPIVPDEQLHLQLSFHQLSFHALICRDRTGWAGLPEPVLGD
jgi:hypothetical protein